MALKELLIRLKAAEYLGSRREEEEKEKVQVEPLQEAWERAGHYFHTIFKEETDDFNQGFRDQIKADLATLTNYLNKASTEEDDKPREKINTYSIFLRRGHEPTPERTKQILTEYFGPGKVQREYPGDDPDSLVFPELAILQKEGRKTEWYFGRNNIIIMEGQTAYRRMEFDRVELAVFRPHDTRGDFSLYLYEYSIYDFDPKIRQIRETR